MPPPSGSTRRFGISYPDPDAPGREAGHTPESRAGSSAEAQDSLATDRGMPFRPGADGPDQCDRILAINWHSQVHINRLMAQGSYEEADRALLPAFSRLYRSCR